MAVMAPAAAAASGTAGPYFRALFLEGEMSRLIREKDWSSTSFGPIESWPTCLKVALDIALPNQFPIVIFWGPEYRMLYNDAYRPVFGRDKHPGYIGESYGDCWPTVWETEKRKMDDVRLSAKANWYTDSYTPVIRSGYLEETYFTYSYSPLFLEDGSVGGLYATVSETTSRVIGERQLRVLRELSAHVVDATGPKDALQKTADVVSTSGKWDVPFVNLYLIDSECKHAILSTATGLSTHAGFLCPEVVTLSHNTHSRNGVSGDEGGSSSGSSSEDEEAMVSEQSSFWSDLFDEVVRSKSSREHDLVQFGDAVPICAAWEVRPRMCVVMPMMSQTSEKVVGILVAGVNPCHDLDENYRIFLNLFCNQVSAALASSIAREEERKRAEALEELDKAKTAFFSNISHEFRTPLTLMLGPIEDLLSHAELQIEREQLTLVHRNALRLYKLVNSLLDFSRIEAGRARAQFEATDLTALTADLASIFRSATERSGLELITDIQTLPQQVFVDKEMWEKIVLNLVSNALKFTMHGHIAVSLSQSTSSPNCAELTVSDTGIGIPEDEMAHLGRRFHRIQTPGGRSYEGTGIGLAMVYELVRLHGGKVEASSQLGQGTMFRITIPFGVSHLPSDQLKNLARFAPGSSHVSPRNMYSSPAPTPTPSSTSPASTISSASTSSASSMASSPDNQHLPSLTSRLDSQTHLVATGAKDYAKMASWWLPSIAAVSSPTSVCISSSPSPSTSSSSSPTLFSSSPTPSSPESSSPRFRTAALSYSIVSDASPKRSTQKRLPKPKVLLADDNFDMREYVARLLAPKYEVISVSNGLEALSVLRAHSHVVDLVLTDVMMPFLDGFGLLKEIRSKDETRTLPVIMLSARAGEEASVEGLDEGADDYLTKPFTARELLSRVASHLKMSRLRLEAAKIEHELRMEISEGKQRLERILASIQDAFISLDARLRYTFANNNAAVLLGVKKEAMIGQSVWRFMVDDEEGTMRLNLEKAVKDKIDVGFEFYYSALDRWIENRIYPGADGGVTIYSVDITARKKSEERLALLAKVGDILSASVDSRLLSVLATVVQHVGDSVVADWCILDVVDENGALQRIASSRASPDLWELHKRPADGKSAPRKCYVEMELCNGEQVGLVSDLQADLDFVTFVMKGRGKTFGSCLFARRAYSPRSYPHEDKAVCAELARRVAMAIDNMFLYREAEKANHAKDHFLAALSHELRTPLTPALLLSESLLGDKLPPHVEASVRMIHESVELEVQLIDDLLDLTKITRNKVKLTMSEVSVHAILARTMQIVSHDSKAKDIAVTLDTSAINDRLVGDSARLQQVFWNIIKNAIKFTSAGGSIVIRSSNYVVNEEHGGGDGKDSAATVEPLSPQESAHRFGSSASDSPDPQQQPRILTAEKRARVMLRVDVIDTGIGIESHALPRLFRAFEQGDASITLRFGGLGLGLAISRSLVEMHHGHISASSEGLSHGSTFSVCLPTLERETAEPTPPSPSEEKATKQSVSAVPSTVTPSTPLPSTPPVTRFPASLPPMPAKPLKVLLVEDNKSTLMIMSRLLRQKLGFTVLVAVSVAGALKVAEEEKGVFDLVISDIGLPDGTGNQLMHTLKSRYDLRGIALSGYGMEEDVRRSMEAGFLMHLTKPVHFSSLTDAIQTLFASSSPPSSSSSSSSSSQSQSSSSSPSPSDTTSTTPSHSSLPPASSTASSSSASTSTSTAPSSTSSPPTPTAVDTSLTRAASSLLIPASFRSPAPPPTIHGTTSTTILAPSTSSPPSSS